MGCDYTSHGFIGIRVPETSARREQFVKTFEHNHPPEWKVDPQTGKALWRMEFVSQPGFDEDCETFAGRYKVLWGMERYRQPHRDCFILLEHASHSDSGSGGGKLAPFDLHKVTKGLIEFQTVLEKHGLWNPAEFGLWSYLYISC